MPDTPKDLFNLFSKMNARVWVAASESKSCFLINIFSLTFPLDSGSQSRVILLREHFGDVWRHGLSQLRKCYWHLQHSLPTTKNYSTPNIHSAGVEIRDTASLTKPVFLKVSTKDERFQNPLCTCSIQIPGPYLLLSQNLGGWARRRAEPGKPVLTALTWFLKTWLKNSGDGKTTGFYYPVCVYRLIPSHVS